MKTKIDLTGNCFGKLTVLEKANDYISPKGKKSHRWNCKCECGIIKTIAQSSLMYGSSTSCGCSKYESKTKHGMYGTKLYNIWSGMKQRCNYKKEKRYKDYGGRGITYCSEWEEFENFAKWAFQSGYIDGLSIERNDVNKGYFPSNCTWIPLSKQARNRRPSLRITEENDEEKLVIDIAEELGISPNVVRARYRSGWDLKTAVYTPLIMQTVRKKVVKKDLNTRECLAVYESIGKASKDVGIDRSSISRCCSGQLKKSGGFAWEYVE